MTHLILVAVAAALGYLLSEVILRQKLKKLQEELKNAYHSGFEAGMEKATNDRIAHVNAASQKEQEQLAVKNADLLDAINYLDAVNYQVSSLKVHDAKTKQKTKSKPKKKAKKKRGGK